MQFILRTVLIHLYEVCSTGGLIFTLDTRLCTYYHNDHVTCWPILSNCGKTHNVIMVVYHYYTNVVNLLFTE